MTTPNTTATEIAERLAHETAKALLQRPTNSATTNEWIIINNSKLTQLIAVALAASQVEDAQNPASLQNRLYNLKDELKHLRSAGGVL